MQIATGASLWYTYSRRWRWIGKSFIMPTVDIASPAVNLSDCLSDRESIPRLLNEGTTTMTARCAPVCSQALPVKSQGVLARGIEAWARSRDLRNWSCGSGGLRGPPVLWAKTVILLVIIEIKAWISDYSHAIHWDVITHPSPSFNGGLVQPPLKSGHGPLARYV